jgi:hypothetical protein
MARDPNFSQVSLLLHCNGANASTTFTDSSPTPKTVTPVSTVQISTEQSKWGGASALFNGTSDYFNVASGTSCAFGTGDFTIEFWMYATDNAANHGIYDSRGEAGNAAGGIYILITTSDRLLVEINGSQVLSCSSGVTINAWHHIALTRAGDQNRIFLDGVLKQTATNSTTLLCGAGYPEIGVYPNHAGAFYKGYLDDIRVTKGLARYVSAFTPPTAEFPDIGVSVTENARRPNATLKSRNLPFNFIGK